MIVGNTYAVYCFQLIKDTIKSMGRFVAYILYVLLAQCLFQKYHKELLVSNYTIPKSYKFFKISDITG